MEVPTIEIDREEARKRVLDYTANRRKKLTEADRALMQGYRALSEGLTLIDVNAAIKAGGQFDRTYCPKLALARADVKTCFFHHGREYLSSAIASHDLLVGAFSAWNGWRDERSPLYQSAVRKAAATSVPLGQVIIDEGFRIELEPGTLTGPENMRGVGNQRWMKANYAADVPDIPIQYRPNGDVGKYFVLWEVEQWREIYRPAQAPRDPLLLERIAHPIYVVVAQWDLTELEQRILESFRRRGQ